MSNNCLEIQPWKDVEGLYKLFGSDGRILATLDIVKDGTLIVQGYDQLLIKPYASNSVTISFES